MVEQINDRSVFTLLEVTRSIQKTLRQRYGSSFWVKGEMIRLNHYPHSGHCYPDLVEKREGRIVAQIRANLWKADYQRVNRRFQQILKEPLKDGIKILFLAKIEFDPHYGLSLHILDIDPSFTLGDLEHEKQATIERLKKEQLFGKNKKLQIPLLPNRIAVISVETSKGFADFRKIVDANEFGYTYFYFLFPALLQGDQAVASILRALERIRRVRRHFDLVAIIRGGGGDIGLSCYNDFELTKALASFPLPVITGIGHATNETVAEMIACENCITPTKMAEWLLQKTHQFALPVQQAKKYITDKTRHILSEKRAQLSIQMNYFKSATLNRLAFNRNLLSAMRTAAVQQSFFILKDRKNKLVQKKIELNKNVAALVSHNKDALKSAQQSIKLMDPIHVLKRGYSITYVDDKLLATVDKVQKGAEITTQLSDGLLKGKVILIKKINPDE